jgi:hypothetical protein
VSSSRKAARGDLDLLGLRDPDPQVMLAVFREICAVEMDDGVVFNVAGLAVDLICREFEYGGLRIKTHAEIAGARVRMVIDIGFGDGYRAQARRPVRAQRTVHGQSPLDPSRHYGFQN